MIVFGKMPTRICNRETGELTSEHSTKAYSIGVFENGLLALGTDDGSIEIVNLSSKEIVRRFKAHKSFVCSLIVLSDGKLLLAASAKER